MDVPGGPGGGCGTMAGVDWLGPVAKQEAYVPVKELCPALENVGVVALADWDPSGKFDRIMDATLSSNVQSFSSNLFFNSSVASFPALI